MSTLAATCSGTEITFSQCELSPCGSSLNNSHIKRTVLLESVKTAFAVRRSTLLSRAKKGKTVNQVRRAYLEVPGVSVPRCHFIIIGRTTESRTPCVLCNIVTVLHVAVADTCSIQTPDEDISIRP